MNNLITLKHVCYCASTEDGDKQLLSDISFCVKPGEFWVFLGPSSTKKTLLLSFICGFLKPSSGTIHTACSHIGYMQNHEKFLEWRSLFYNASLGADVIPYEDHFETPQNDYVSHMMKACHIDDLKALKPSQVSATTKKKVSLIRALASEPELLIMDDVFSSLDHESRTSLRQEIHTLLKKDGKAAILTTHDITEAILFGDKALVLSGDGKHMQIFSLSFPDIADVEALRLKSDRFHFYFNEIWRELNRSSETI